MSDPNTDLDIIHQHRPEEALFDAGELQWAGVMRGIMQLELLDVNRIKGTVTIRVGNTTQTLVPRQILSVHFTLKAETTHE